MGRAPCCDKANVKKGPWSPEEDAILKSYIHNHGTAGNWIALPQKIGLKRCGKSCRLRWLNYLRPNIKHGGFTEDEDNLICSLYITIGSRWSIIAAQLPGRTDNDIKNYWNTRLKKKLLGKQRREQQLAARRGKLSETKKGSVHQSYSMNDFCFGGGGLYSKPLQQPSQLENHQFHEPTASNYSLASVPLAPLQLEANSHGAHDYSNCEISNYPKLESDYNYIINNGEAVNYFPALEYGVSEEMMSDGVDNSFSAVDMVRCGTVSSGNANWGDVNGNEKMVQDWTMLFDEPRLLGYSQ